MRCKKVSGRKGVQLEDFNHAMLRFIYAFHLAFYTVAVFILGLLLVPLGYLAVLMMRFKLIVGELKVRHRREGLMARRI